MSAEIVAVTRLASCLRAQNPGPMTLDGTNTWLLRAPGREGLIVVDPGPDLPEHVQALAAAGPVELVLITHRHSDHTEAIDALHRLTGAPVRAALPEHCRAAQPLRDGERVVAAGVELEVLATPGHTSDSLSFRVLHDAPLPQPGPVGQTGSPVPAAVDGPAPQVPAPPPLTDPALTAPIRTGSLLTGDTVLGRGTTMLDHPDGTLADYLRSLDRLEAASSGDPGLPAHGAPIPDLAAVCRDLRRHRLERLAEVRAAVSELGEDATAAQLAMRIYPEVPERVRPAAERSIEAQLAHLRGA